MDRTIKKQILTVNVMKAAGKGELIDLLAKEEPSSRIRRRKNEPVRLQDATSIPLEQWRVFLAVVGEAATHSTPASVIDVLCMSALRIGDVLRTSRTALDAGFAREDGITTIGVKGARGQRRVIYSVLGARDEWERLRVKIPRGKLVCDVVAPRGKPGDWTASGAAYQACRRKLAELGAKAGIEDRLHLHRLRRTVAVQAALATGNKLLVQKLLRQHSAASAERYTDEAMEAEIVAALAQIRRKVRG